MTRGSDEIVVVLPAATSMPANELRHAVGAQLQRTVGGGLSLPGSFDTVNLCADQARTAARAHHDNEFREFGDLGVFGIILGNRTTAELDLLARKLDPLDTADRTVRVPGDGLLATLAAYLRHNGHIESAAADLGVHRHTLRNRIGKISELTDSDLGTADSRAELWLALKARDLRSLRTLVSARSLQL